jgi:pimeloyl-ACP methyl ester carboxylesterase
VSLPQFDRFDVRAADGTRLEAQSFGSGPLTMVIANGLGGTLLAWAPLLRAMENRVRFVSWDYRGLYGSERPTDRSRLRVEHHVDDMRAVMEAAEVDTAIIAGWSMGVQVCVQAAADLRSRVDGLVLINGTYGKIFDTAFPNPVSRRVLPLVNRAAIAVGPALPPLVGFATRRRWFLPTLERLGLTDANLDREVFKAIAQGFEDLDFSTYHRIMGHLHEHDGEAALRSIEQPLLLVAGQRDSMTPASVRHAFEEHVPHCETYLVPRGTHYSLIEYPHLVVRRIEEFLGEHFRRGLH